MKTKINFECGISFADAECRNIQIDANDNLVILLVSWDEKEIKIEFSNILCFSYIIGDIISDLYVTNSGLFLDKALEKYYLEKPLDSPFKHYQIEDVSGFPFIEVVAEHICVIKTDQTIPFTNLRE